MTTVHVFDVFPLWCFLQTVEDSGVGIVWGDGHQSVYSAEWLLAHRLSSDPTKSRNTRFQLPAREHWTAEQFPCREKRFSLKSLSEPQALLDFLLFLHRYGVAMLKDCGTEVGAVMEISDRVALLRETVFGYVEGLLGFWQEYINGVYVLLLLDFVHFDFVSSPFPDCCPHHVRGVTSIA